MAELNIPMNKAFVPYLYDYSNRFNVYHGGRASGKSYFIDDKLIIKALSSKRRILFVKKVAASIKDSLWQLTLDELETFNVISHCKINSSTYNITLPEPYQSVFLFKGFDDENKAKSIQGLTDCFIDEADQLTYEDFDNIDKSIRHATAPDQQIYLAFNPAPMQNWVYKHWFENGEVPNTFYHHSTYKDNAFLTQAIIDSIEYLKVTNPQRYKMIGEGLFVSLDKQIYPKYEIQEFNHSDIEGIYIFGLDFGYTNDPSAFVVAKVDLKNKIIYIFDEHYQTGMTNDAIANMIRYKGYAKEIITADAAEPKSIEEIRKQGISRIKAATKGAGSVNQGIQFIQQFKIVVHPSCTNTCTELDNYTWKKDKQGNYTNEPIDSFNHILDALRYGIQVISKNNKVKILDKSLFGF